MKPVIIGTAGHIDHGKTALVKALTGIDADRLAEEKRRGITIDLGFAHLDLPPSLRLGFVDVPGHERFVKNMLAGVGGIDCVLFVVAADESVKPQTREHFEICRLLGIRRGIIALTKADLADPDLLALARLEVEELVAGSFLASAPIVPVSAVTGAGLDQLRAALASVAAAVPERDPAAWFRLPIDRVFSVKGFGTVATGTLVSGSVAKEQEVELYTASASRRLRVRGVEVHGSQTGRAVAGQRTALNLADIEPADLRRGDVLSEPGRFHSVQQIECRLELLRSSPPLKHRAPVHFHSGTAEIEAEIRLLESTAPLPPGTTSYVRLILREPALLLPGDRFIIRRFSPVVTIGGGTVVDIERSPKSADIGKRLDVLSGSDDAPRIALLVRESEFGLSLPGLVARTGLAESEIAAAASRAPLAALAAPQPWYIDRAFFQSARDVLVKAVREFHRANPMLPGIPKENLRAQRATNSRPPAPAPRPVLSYPLFLLDALLAAAPDLVVEGETVRLRTHAPVLKEDETQARNAIERSFEQAGLATPAVAEVLAKSGVEARRARTLLEILVREKRLVRVSDDLVFHASAIDKLRQELTARRPARFNVGTFKEWTGISRKYAIPLLEYLDRSRVTRREGDERLIL